MLVLRKLTVQVALVRRGVRLATRPGAPLRKGVALTAPLREARRVQALSRLYPGVFHYLGQNGYGIIPMGGVMVGKVVWG